MSLMNFDGLSNTGDFVTNSIKGSVKIFNGIIISICFTGFGPDSEFL